MTSYRQRTAVSGDGWWWRLQLLRWNQAEKERRIRRAVRRAIWWLCCVIAPTVASLNKATANTAIDLLLSIDIPLALILAACVVVGALDAASRRGDEDWLWPRSHRPKRVRWLARLRWLPSVRWPAGVAIAAVILRLGGPLPVGRLEELLFLTCLAVVLGFAVVWVMPHAGDEARQRPRSRQGSSAKGLAALSWVPMRETWNRFDLKRVMIASLPVMLSAPAGASANQIASVLVAYLPMIFVVLVCRECLKTQASIFRWLPAMSISRARVVYWVWRHVAASLALVLLGISGSGSCSPGIPW